MAVTDGSKAHSLQPNSGMEQVANLLLQQREVRSWFHGRGGGEHVLVMYKAERQRYMYIYTYIKYIFEIFEYNIRYVLNILIINNSSWNILYMSFIATLSRRISLQLVGGVTVLALSKPKSITWGNFGPRPAGRWDIWDARNFFNAWMHGWWRPTKPWWCVELSTWWGSPRVGRPGNPWEVQRPKFMAPIN